MTSSTLRLFLSATACATIAASAADVGLSQCRADCPSVSIDENRNMVVNGSPFFPVGFWAFYYSTPDCDETYEYSDHFNMVVDDYDGLISFIENPIRERSVYMICQSALRLNGDTGELEARKLDELQSSPGIIAWEKFHEMDYYHSDYDKVNGEWIYDGLGGDAFAQQEFMEDWVEDNDGCGRPILLTPTITGATGQWLVDHVDAGDFVGAQAAYRTPFLDVAGAGRNIAKAVDTAGDTPVFLIMHVAGHQPGRFRTMYREPSRQEMRVQSYLSIINGAKGVLFYNYRKGGSAVYPEPSDAVYDVEESPKHLEDLRNLGSDLLEHTYIFQSPVAADVDVTTIGFDTLGIQCQAWEHDGSKQVICANVADESSPYFAYAMGDDHKRVWAHAFDTNGAVYPQYECMDGRDNDGDGYRDFGEDLGCSYATDDEEGSDHVTNIMLNTNSLYIAEIWTGKQLADVTIDRISLQMESLFATTLGFAIYSDGEPFFTNTNSWADGHFDINRDYCPDYEIYRGTANLNSNGVNHIPLDPTVVFEHARKYYILVWADEPGVSLRGRKHRYGAMSKEANRSFLDYQGQGPPLRWGKQQTGQLKFSNVGQYYCVERDWGTGSGGSLDANGAIAETFDPYAVHIYTFFDELHDLNTNGVPDECEADCNANGTIDMCEFGGLIDCNSNGTTDLCDIDSGASLDCDGNGIPDECDGYLSGVLYVDDSATSGRDNGTDWDNAYIHLEDALDHARCADGAVTEIHIGEGTYYPNTNGLAEPRTANFQLIDGVSLLGGYEGVGSALPERRIPSTFVVTISGDIGIPGNDTDNCYHLFFHPSGLSLDETAVLDGVTVTDGNANGPTTGHHDYGGAIYNGYPSKPTLRNCTFVDNYAATRGGAICNDQYCYPLMEDCVFEDNTCGGSGGAVYNYLSGPTLTRCSFIDNWAGSQSGAMHCFRSSDLLTDCIFIGNSTNGSAGAMYAYDADLTLVNCLFSGNSAAVSGGAIKNYTNELTLINCTFNDHYAGAHGGTLDTYDSVLNMTNSVIWDSYPTAMRNEYPIHLAVSYSCIEGGFAGTGNINSNPLFIDADGPDNVAGTSDDNLRLSSDSPCIDAGSNSDVPADAQDLDGDENTVEQLPWDLDDNDRFVDDPFTADTGTGTPPIVDMGAYEFWPDCNSNGISDYSDIGGISTDCNSNSIPDECEPDCNANAIADECDIAGGTSLDLNTNGIPDECEPAPPAVTATLSIKTHGTPGTDYSIAAPATECRLGGISEVKLCFDRIAYSTDGDDFVAGDFTLSRGTIRNISTAWDDARLPILAEITLEISDVAKMGQLTISFSAENSVGLAQNCEACLNYIPADVDSDGDVDGTDGAMIEAADGDPLFLNCRYDLDLNGVIEGDYKDGEDWTIWSGITPVLEQILCGS